MQFYILLFVQSFVSTNFFHHHDAPIVPIVPITNHVRRNVNMQQKGRRYHCNWEQVFHTKHSVMQKYFNQKIVFS